MPDEDDIKSGPIAGQTDPTPEPANPADVKPAAQAPEEHHQEPDLEPTNPSDVPQPTGDGRTVHLPAVISDLFGTPAVSARQMIAGGQVTVGGQRLKGPNKFDPLYDEIIDKEIIVEGEFRAVKFTYSG